MPIRVTALAFDLCVLYYRSPYVPYSSLSSQISGKEGGFNSKYIYSVFEPMKTTAKKSGYRLVLRYGKD